MLTSLSLFTKAVTHQAGIITTHNKVVGLIFSGDFHLYLFLTVSNIPRNPQGILSIWTQNKSSSNSTWVVKYWVVLHLPEGSSVLSKTQLHLKTNQLWFNLAPASFKMTCFCKWHHSPVMTEPDSLTYCKILKRTPPILPYSQSDMGNQLLSLFNAINSTLSQMAYLTAITPKRQMSTLARAHQPLATKNWQPLRSFCCLESSHKPTGHRAAFH